MKRYIMECKGGRIVSIALALMMILTCIMPLNYTAYAAGDSDTSTTEEEVITVATPKIKSCVAGFQSVTLKWSKVTSDYGKVYYQVLDGNNKNKVVYDGTKTKKKLDFDPYPGKTNGQAKYGKKAKSGEALKANYSVRAYIKNPANKKKKIYSEKATKNNIEIVHPMYVIVKAKRNASILDSSTSNKKVGTAKKGKYYVVFGGSRIKGENKRVIIKIKNKKGEWQARYIRSTDVDVVRYVFAAKTGGSYYKVSAKNSFTPKQVENFFNDHKLSSKTNYAIWVNTYNQRVYLFKRANKKSKWKIYRHDNGMLCNTGKELSPYGSYQISNTMAKKKTTGTKWWLLFNHVGVHQKLYDKLGQPASGGCVRIPTDEAKWCFDNIPRGTGIFVY